MNVKATKNRSKKQTDELARPEMDTAQLIELGHSLKSRMQLAHAANQLEAIAAQTAARRKLIVTAHDLLSKAKALAEKGKPRLLAVLTKIINDRNIKFGAK
jgi:hypothetical protein